MTPAGQIFRFFLFLLVFCGAAAAPLHSSLAQSAAPAAANPPPLSQEDARKLLGVLNDPRQREQFTQTLSLMARGLSAQQKPASGTTAKSVDSAIDHDIATDFGSIGHSLNGYAHNFAGLFINLKSVAVWARTEFSNPDRRDEFLNIFSRALIILLTALAAERGTSILLRGRLNAVTARARSHETDRRTGAVDTDPADPAPDDAAALPGAGTRADDERRQRETLKFLARVPYVVLHLLLKLVPVAVFLCIGYAGGSFMTDTVLAASVVFTLTNAYVIARGFFLLVETALAPKSPEIRLTPASDETARLLVRWWMLLVAAPSIVVCLSKLGGEFNLSEQGTQAMIRAVVLAEHLIIAAFIWRVRKIVTRTLQPSGETRKTAFGAALSTLASFWWIPTLFLDGALWLVWAARLRGGYTWILQAVGMTVAIIAVSRLVSVLLYGLQDRLFRISPEMIREHPDMQKRADRYYPFVRGVMTALIMFVTVVAVTESWGIRSWYFFTASTLGSRLLNSAMTLVIAASVAAMIWEVINAALNRQLERYNDASLASRATRLRTVMPIIRTMLLTVIIIIVLVTSLSQIGINIAPLLTGAGIMGAAIAFGSQSLVKDFITGFFMLVEDAIQVGDWVTVGNVSGNVENLSIRAVKIRSFDGDLHVIPFSSVSTIANTARDFNQIIVSQTVDLGEDYGRVAGIMRDVVEEMRQEDGFRSIILSGYNDLGVNLADGNGAVVFGTIRTGPMMKWKVWREFYKRLGNRMVEAGVSYYTPTSFTASAPNTALNLAMTGRIPGSPPPAPEGTKPDAV
ncbi:mechanosensitive ion channel [Acetobacter sp. AN02]|uniref:mechanosensitive ion channel family protein n=1 Tax=Acetobacter sp. AN02 TaxID=2894186 RepID=UPI0024344C9D|nr:mechanosensitive ion channel domain-containing protein [Acetobacter sp. AN02]MDG6093800.1 mechanosensitive ion channel [Acetobacter sp. AN02]